jgi:hypothetical protein
MISMQQQNQNQQQEDNRVKRFFNEARTSN